MKRDIFPKMRSEDMDKKDLSQNCDFDDDSGKNDCWHCQYFLFPIGCMYGEDEDREDNDTK